MFEIVQVTFPFPIITAHGWQVIYQALADFFTLWVCVGVMMLSILPIVELFNPTADYKGKFMPTYLKWYHEPVVLLFGILLWPITVYVIWLTCRAISEDMSARKEKEKSDEPTH